MDTIKRPFYQVVESIRIPGMFSLKCVKEAFSYKPTSDDIIVVTYPKCGTTWMQNMMIGIFRKGQPLEKPFDFFTASPFIDMLGEDGVRRMPRPGSIKTHLPYTHMPYSDEAKYIFVIRNPFDTCVSLFHHTTMHPGLMYADGTFDEFFELFITGEVEYNDYFDHLLSWYSHKDDKNLFYTTYEDMKKDPKAVILKLADFIGKEYPEIVRNDDIMKNILKMSSLQYMKEHFADIYDAKVLKEILTSNQGIPEGLRHLGECAQAIKRPETAPKMQFVRKGIVGDWKNYFSKNQLRRMKEKFILKTAGTDISNLWPNLFQEM